MRFVWIEQHVHDDVYRNVCVNLDLVRMVKPYGEGRYIYDFANGDSVISRTRLDIAMASEVERWNQGMYRR